MNLIEELTEKGWKREKIRDELFLLSPPVTHRSNKERWASTFAVVNIRGRKYVIPEWAFSSSTLA